MVYNITIATAYQSRQVTIQNSAVRHLLPSARRQEFLDERWCQTPSRRTNCDTPRVLRPPLCLGKIYKVQSGRWFRHSPLVWRCSRPDLRHSNVQFDGVHAHQDAVCMYITKTLENHVRARNRNPDLFWCSSKSVSALTCQYRQPTFSVTIWAASTRRNTAIVANRPCPRARSRAGKIVKIFLKWGSSEIF